MSRSRVKRLRTLEERAEYLDVRVREKNGVACGYERAELAALRWALPILEGAIEANRRLHEQLREEKGRRVDLDPEELGYGEET